MFRQSGASLQGSLCKAGTFPIVVKATNAYGSTTRTITLNVARRFQWINLYPVNNRLTTAPPFTVYAGATTYRNSNVVSAYSGPSTFTATGVCTVGGAQGDTITLTGAPGICTITAVHLGDANYLPASSPPQDITVTTAASERFPANCQMPAGWTVPGGATTGWSVSINDSSSDGACSLQSNGFTGPGSAVIQYTGTFVAGNVSFTRHIFAGRYDCLRFLVDSVIKYQEGDCYGVADFSVELFYNGAYTVPITAGTHTLRFEFVNILGGSAGTAWIDELVLPQATLAVTKTGAGLGTVSTSPGGIYCGSTCTRAMGGRIRLTAVANAGSAFTGWTGGGCSGMAPCDITLSANTSISANFITVSAPTAPLSVMAAAGPLSATLTFSPPSSNGGGVITQYNASCSAGGQTTRTANSAASPLLVSGLTGGVQYTCTITATNTGGTGPASAPVNVTPISLNFTGNVTSMQNHGAAGALALAVNAAIPIDGLISVDPRESIGPRELRFLFDNAISSVAGATATDAAGNALGTILATPNGNTVVVTLNGIPNGARVRITLPVINGSNLNIVASIGFLQGDVTGSGRVTAADIAAIKARVGQPIAALNGNAIYDLNRDGVINAADVSMVRTRSGSVMP